MRSICLATVTLIAALAVAGGCGSGSSHPLSPIALVFAGRGGGSWDVYVVRGGNVQPLQAQAGDQLNPSTDDHRELCVYEDRSGGDGDVMIVRLPDGQVRPLVSGPTDDCDPAISMDGTKVVFVRRTAEGADLWVINSDGTGLKRLTDWQGNEIDPAWSADGRAVYFAADRDGDYDIYRIELHGTGVAKVVGGPGDQRYPALQVAFERIVWASNEDGDWELYVRDARDVDGAGTKLTDDNWDEIYPTFSRAYTADDTITFASNATGTWRLMRMRTAPVTAPTAVDTAGVEAWQPAL